MGNNEEITIKDKLKAGERKFILPTINNEKNISFIDVNVNIIGFGPLQKVSRASIDFCFPNDKYQSIPREFCRADETSLLIAPVPNQDYEIEIWGTVRIASI